MFIYSTHAEGIFFPSDVHLLMIMDCSYLEIRCTVTNYVFYFNIF